MTPCRRKLPLAFDNTPLPMLSEHIPTRLYPSQQPIPHHRLHGAPQVLDEAEQPARLHRDEDFGMLLEQRHNAPTHVAAGDMGVSWGARSWGSRHRGTAGCLKEPVIPMLHVLEHVEQERAFFSRGLAVGTGRLQLVTHCFHAVYVTCPRAPHRWTLS